MVENIETSDIAVQIDYMENNFIDGFNIREVTIYVPQYDNCWAYGSYPVTLNVSKIVDDVNVN